MAPTRRRNKKSRRLRRRRRSPQKGGSTERIPIFIIVYNNYTFLKATIDQLAKFANPNNPVYVIDNKSTYPPLLEYFTTLENNKTATVLRMDQNYGHRVYERDEIVEKGGDKYIVTDPDLLFNPALPPDFIDQLSKISDTHKAAKVGFALDITDNINLNKFYEGKTLPEHEAHWWADRVQDPTYELYMTQIDTTFALINKKYYVRGRLDNGIRVAGNFTAKHKTWLNDWEKEVPEEERNYYFKDNKSTTIDWWSDNKQDSVGKTPPRPNPNLVPLIQ